MSELRRALRLAQREDAKKRAQGRVSDDAMARLKHALYNAKQESSDEATTAYLNSVRERLHALDAADPSTQITRSLNALADVLGVGR